MTETQSSPPGPQAESTPPQAGVDRENLRNYERLRRSLSDRKIAGVAGGLGRHLDIDPTIIRVLLVVLCFFGGAGFLLYGVAWLLVPLDGQQDGRIATSPSTRNGLLIATGVVAALLLLGDSWNGVGFPWPALLVGIGVVLYLLLRDQPPASPQQAPHQPAQQSPSSSPSSPPSSRHPPG